MPRTQRVARLHLPALTIKGFRGVKSLSIPKLSRVTLLAGKNSVGKTSVLEAVEAFAARGRRSTLFNILEKRNEWINMTDEDGDEFPGPDITALFYGRTPSEDAPILIGPSEKAPPLRIAKASLNDLDKEQMAFFERYTPEIDDDDDFQLFKSAFQGKRGVKVEEYMIPQMMRRRIPFWLREESRLPAATRCVPLGPGLLGNDEITRFWDGVALTDDEDRALEALKLIFRDKVERITAIGEEGGRRGRRVIVKLKDHPQPVPLKSLGDGAVRLFSVALALANSRDGILLLDEAENGIHHSVQRDFWRMVLRMARENSTQVLATTHSWDCVRGFAQAAADDENNEGILIRLDEQDDEGIRSVSYSEDKLRIAAEQGIEVR